MKPTLTINGHDYAAYIEELQPVPNDLDAEGSGRDVQTGLMHRVKVATKQKWSVQLLPMDEALAAQLYTDLSSTFFDANVLDPTTNTVATKTFYCSSVPFGLQRWRRRENKTYYEGVSFEMIER